MNDLRARLSASQLDKLIAHESLEIQKIEEDLTLRRLKLVALQMYNQKLSHSATDELWLEFISRISKQAPELSLLLKQVTLISLTPGKLLLRADEPKEGELLRLRKSVIEAALREHFECDFTLEVRDE